jgi:hypothetical protein
MPDPGDVITDDQYPGWRARLVHDEDAGQPCGDALAPALLVWHGQPATFATDVFVPRHQREIAHAYGHYADPVRFERYLRIVHGATTIVTVEDRDLTVWIFDTSDYRAHIGHTGPIDVTGEHTEWRAWADGDVYGVVVENRHTGTTLWDDGGIDEVEQWRQVDSLWGLYGHDYATGTARELLTDHAG